MDQDLRHHSASAHEQEYQVRSPGWNVICFKPSKCDHRLPRQPRHQGSSRHNYMRRCRPRPNGRIPGLYHGTSVESHERVTGFGPDPPARTEERSQDDQVRYERVLGGKRVETSNAQARTCGPDFERRQIQQGRADVWPASILERTGLLSMLFREYPLSKEDFLNTQVLYM